MSFLRLSIVFIIVLVTYEGYGQHPGGISTNLRFWLKANEGVSCSTNGCAVNTWDNNESITDVPDSVFNTTASTQPVLNTSSINYNPSIDFASGDRLASITNKGVISYGVSIDFYAVCESNSDEGTILSDNFRYSTAGSNDQGWQVGVGNNVGGTHSTAINAVDFRCEVGSGANLNYKEYSGANTVVKDKPHIISLSKDFSSTPLTTYSSDMQSFSKTASGNYTPTHTRINMLNFKVIIGESDDASKSSWSPPFVGKMSEIIVYQGILDQTEKLKVHSYLGIKYGITLNRTGSTGIYLNTTGDSIYYDEGVATYWNDIIGIGRDDDNELLQKQSHQEDDSTRVYISTLQNDNLSNSGTFTATNQYLVMGHNGEELSSLLPRSTEVPGGEGIYNRIQREWKIMNTNFSDNFSMDIKLNTSVVNPADIRILIDEDGDFSDATVYNPTITFSSGVLTISGINTTMIPVDAIRYLTIATLSPNTPLPVSLTSFNAVLNDRSTVDINLKSASLISGVLKLVINQVRIGY